MQKQWSYFLTFLILTATSALRSEVKVAFLELINPNGKVVQLESNFNYSHVAIEFEDGWLHAYPGRGVEILSTDELEEIGRVAVVLNSPQKNVNKLWVQQWLGRPYDSNYAWDDSRFYCSELVGKLLGMHPQPMHFDLKFWPPSFQQYEGKPGLSPKGIYNALLNESAQ